MKQYYIIEDGALKAFESKEDLIAYLPIPLKKKLNKTKAQWMEHINSLGHSITDDYSFYQTLTDQFEMGVIREGGRRVRCDIFYAAKPNDANGM